MEPAWVIRYQDGPKSGAEEIVLDRDITPFSPFGGPTLDAPLPEGKVRTV